MSSPRFPGASAVSCRRTSRRIGRWLSLRLRFRLHKILASKRQYYASTIMRRNPFNFSKCFQGHDPGFPTPFCCIPLQQSRAVFVPNAAHAEDHDQHDYHRHHNQADDCPDFHGAPPVRKDLTKFFCRAPRLPHCNRSNIYPAKSPQPNRLYKQRSLNYISTLPRDRWGYSVCHGDVV